MSCSVPVHIFIPPSYLICGFQKRKSYRVEIIIAEFESAHHLLNQDQMMIEQIFHVKPGTSISQPQTRHFRHALAVISPQRLGQGQPAARVSLPRIKLTTFQPTFAIIWLSVSVSNWRMDV
jgi:hypothetical protein